MARKSTKQLVMVFLDSGNKPFNIIIDDPRDNIEASELTDFETFIVDENVFIGKAGKIKGFGSAFYIEKNYKELLA